MKTGTSLAFGVTCIYIILFIALFIPVFSFKHNCCGQEGMINVTLSEYIIYSGGTGYSCTQSTPLMVIIAFLLQLCYLGSVVGIIVGIIGGWHERHKKTNRGTKKVNRSNG
jgi:LytS/YehU family sensor histidine kinase